MNRTNGALTRDWLLEFINPNGLITEETPHIDLSEQFNLIDAAKDFESLQREVFVFIEQCQTQDAELPSGERVMTALNQDFLRIQNYCRELCLALQYCKSLEKFKNFSL